MTGSKEPIMRLSKPEWRNIIENYLLNVAVEAQCRYDFKQKRSEYKRWKLLNSNLKRPDMPPQASYRIVLKYMTALTLVVF